MRIVSLLPARRRSGSQRSLRACRVSATVLAGSVAALVVLIGSGAAPSAAQPVRVDQQSYRIDAFDIEYALEHPAQPRIVELEAVELELRVAERGLLPPHPATDNRRFPLGRVPSGSRFYYASLAYVSEQLLAVFQERHIDGVLITFPEVEAESGRDLRPDGATRMRVRIWTGRVERVATLADGERFGDDGPEERTNHEKHRWIREGAPVQAGGPKGLLRVRELEDYAFRLSRHPGRRVSAMLRPGELPGATRVDLHVAESKPWTVYSQFSNTGTEGTTTARQRFGFAHYQLTGNDDVLRFDYVTGNFDEVQGVWGSYDAPVWRLPGVRAQVNGSWSRYDASEVGVNTVDAQGDQWHAGGRLLYQAFQYRELFIDVFAGLSWRNLTVGNRVGLGGFTSASFDQDAEDDFFLPEAGVLLRRHTPISSLALDMSFDTNVASVAGTNTSSLIGLGRTDPEKDFTRFRWQGALSIYLEPMLRWRRWVDPSTPASSTLAHEILVSTKGQASLGDRLIPQFQQIAGGLYTVRGYDQAVVAGDTVAIGSAEYRLHLARLLYPSPDPVEVPVLGKLKVRPEHVYGRPDWDFILKAFVDAARVNQQDRQSFEEDETLIGIGLGFELQFMKYLVARFDVAWPQRSLDQADIDRPELHGLLTLMY